MLGATTGAKETLFMIRHILIPLAFLGLVAPAFAAPPVPADNVGETLQEKVARVLAQAPKGTRFGLLVTDERGREIVAVNPDQRFIPASTTKLFTTAAAYAVLSGINQPDEAGGAQVWLESDGRQRKGGQNVVLFGRGDARMSSAADCKVNCLAQLADAVAAATRTVHDVIGDDTLWADQRWVPGMSWNNIGTDSGTAVSALNLDDNELRIAVSAGSIGKAPVVQIPSYFTLRNQAITAAPGSKTQLFVERAVNGAELRLYGTIAADAAPWSDRLGIDDPAHYAAWVLREMLLARGVKVNGKVRVRHRPAALSDLPDSGAPVPVLASTTPTPLASLVPPPVAEDVVIINKVSQNLHAQALFRRIGSPILSEQGASAAQRKVLEQAGIPALGFEFWDGSGMSTYNRISPRAAIALLRWTQAQPWGAQWLASLPIAGRDGTLKRRFVGTLLEANLIGKTGTLNATNALVGIFTTSRGQRLHFAFFANDVPAGTSAIPTMETALARIASD